MADRIKGIVKWFRADKGYGFITADNGTDYFVHQTSINMPGHRKLSRTQQVNFKVGKDANDNIMAIDVNII